jgi:peptidoglycan/xylan/chitin deacetylase (PgdA/CDA1 family)
MFYLVKTPSLLKKLYPECIWNMETKENEIYLTFDDGPHPQVTQFVLDELKKFNAKATFFCIGKNVKEHFDIYKQIISEGHRPGNHTFNHLNGWKTADKKYLDDIKQAADIIDSPFFRPPYGRATKFQMKALQEDKFQLKTIMWDVLSGDFDEKITPENCYLNVVKYAKAGSIIVFHDSLKALPRLQYALPLVLRFFSEKGFVFKVLPFS